MRIENFKADDYFNMILNPGAGLHRWSAGPVDTAVHFIEMRGMARTLWEGDRIVAIYGANPLWDGVCEVFFIPALGWLNNRKDVCKIVRRELNVLRKLYRRVQMACLADTRHLRFAQFFGFQHEGLLRSYDRFGREYFMLSIIEGGK